MKNCTGLLVTGFHSGSPFPLFECGGSYVEPGDKLIVEKQCAAAIMSRCGTMIEVVKDDIKQEKALSNGHYQIFRSGLTLAEKKKIVATGKMASSVKKDTSKVVEDKSMQGRSKKAVTKKATRKKV